MTYIQNNDPKTLLPLPPQKNEAMTAIRLEDIAVYNRFMKHLRHVPNSRMEIKVLSSIQFTADILGYSDAHVSKILVDLGLRAPRMAFPATFLEFVDASLQRSGWEVGGPSPSLLEMADHWNRIGEDKFAHVRKGYDLLSEELLTV